MLFFIHLNLFFFYLHVAYDECSLLTHYERDLNSYQKPCHIHNTIFKIYNSFIYHTTIPIHVSILVVICLWCVSFNSLVVCWYGIHFILLSLCLNFIFTESKIHSNICYNFCEIILNTSIYCYICLYSREARKFLLY